MRQRDTGQGGGVAGGNARIGGLGLLQRGLGGNGDIAIEAAIKLLDALEVVLGQLDARQRLALQGLGQFGQRFFVHGSSLLSARQDYSMTLGTRYRPSSVAGAMAW